jgi:ZIP family zinc transporter
MYSLSTMNPILMGTIAATIAGLATGVGALPLTREGYSKPRALLYATLTGLVEAPMGLIGAAAVVIMAPLLPYALAFAAGAMLYVISDEIIPETHRRGYEREATFGLIGGFCVMLVLDNMFT